MKEIALSFDCQGDCLYGTVTLPAQPRRRGVLVIVGGPQYRVGSHRQFVLLARKLADAGHPVMRFDYRGMGDSEGEVRSFDAIQADIEAAIRAFLSAAPQVEEIVLWGLCDGASAACLFASVDPRIKGLVLLNPWVRESNTEARATLRHYYWRRLADPAFWRKLASGKFNPFKSAGDIAVLAARAGQGTREGSLPERMLAGLRNFTGRILVITSGNDLTAQEFRDVSQASVSWKTLLESSRTSRHHIEAADHTFARQVWRDEVAAVTSTWLTAPGP
jgi:exosortase A-associated hydrolase 1